MSEQDPTFVDDAEPLAVLRAVAICARSWEGAARLLGNVRACDIVRAVEAFEALVRAERVFQLLKAARVGAAIRQRASEAGDLLMTERRAPARHEHEQGAPLIDGDCDGWCRFKHYDWERRTMTERRNEQPQEPPRKIDPVFLQHATRSTTSYSEGWRDVCARLLWVEAQLDAAERERETLRKDLAYHADCRPNRQQAEKALADAKALNDWRVDVTAAVITACGLEGGLHYDDVVAKVRQLGAAERETANLTEIEQIANLLDRVEIAAQPATAHQRLQEAITRLRALTQKGE